MPRGSKLEKALQLEAETLTNLELRQNQASAVLEDESRLTSSVRVTQGYLTKLEAAVTVYEQAISTLLTTFEADVENKTIYMNKLTDQMKLVDPILN